MHIQILYYIFDERAFIFAWISNNILKKAKIPKLRQHTSFRFIIIKIWHKKTKTTGLVFALSILKTAYFREEGCLVGTRQPFMKKIFSLYRKFPSWFLYYAYFVAKVWLKSKRCVILDNTRTIRINSFWTGEWIHEYYSIQKKRKIFFSFDGRCHHSLCMRTDSGIRFIKSAGNHLWQSHANQ